jgi:hypothetical protein
LNSPNYLFDIEGFYYVHDRNTYFTENRGAIMDQDFKKTQFMLRKFSEVDNELLAILHYINPEGKMPIHYALETNNTRIVNTILSFMA